MSKRVLVEEYQEVTGADLTNIGAYAEAALDTVVTDGITDQNRFAGCATTQNGAATIVVGPGRAYLGGKVYALSSDVEFVLTANLPQTLNRIATVIVAGQSIDTDLQPRDYIINETTGEAEARTAPRERRRQMVVEVVYGSEAINPSRGVVANGAVAVADILLTPAGISTITMLTANRIKSGEENRASITALETFRETAGARIDSLATDIADLGSRTKGILSPQVHSRLIKDVARLKRLARISDNAVSYSFDYFLNDDGSDKTHVQWLAKIEEGIRFPAAQERLALLKPLNPGDPKLKKSGSLALPTYTDNVRISVVGKDEELSISQFQHQTTIQVQKSIARSATRYGPSYTVCTNAAEFRAGTFDAKAQTWTKDGETFRAEFTGKEWDVDFDTGGIEHKEVRVTSMWTDTWTETYWEAQTVTEGLNGSVIGQTFLNANAGWATFLNLYFSRVDASGGDVHVLLTEVTASGAPNPARTIAKTTLTQTQLKAWPQATRVDLVPTHLEAGRRYAIVLITGGNNFIAVVTGNKFAEGTLFHSTDQAWFQGELTKDMAFEVGYAKFSGARVEVDFDPLELENGIANIKLLVAGAVPASTKLTFEYKKDAVWYPIDPGAANLAQPLIGLPALLQLRAVFVGSTDDMPAIDVAESEYTTWRPRSDNRWISDLKDLGTGVTTDTIIAELRVEGFTDAIHDVTISVLAGPGESVEAADAVVIEPDPYDPKAFVYRATFNLAAPVQTYRFKIEGTTTTVVDTFHLASFFQQAL